MPRHDDLPRRFLAGSRGTACGTKRDDIRPGLRITNHKKRAVIAFDVDADMVSIIGVFYGGQDYETILQDESED